MLALASQLHTGPPMQHPGGPQQQPSAAGQPPLPPPSPSGASGLPPPPQPQHWLDRYAPGMRQWLEDKNRQWWIKGLVEARTE